MPPLRLWPPPYRTSSYQQIHGLIVRTCVHIWVCEPSTESALASGSLSPSPLSDGCLVAISRFADSQNALWAQSVDNAVYQPCTAHGLSVRNRLPTLRPHCDFANPLPRYCVVGCSLTVLHTCTSTSTPLMHVRSSIPFIREPRVFFSRERSSVCVSLSHSFDSPSTIPSPQVVRKKSIVALLLLKRSSCLGERARGREGRGDRLATRIYLLRRESGGGLGVTGATNGEPRAGLTSLRCSIFSPLRGLCGSDSHIRTNMHRGIEGKSRRRTRDAYVIPFQTCMDRAMN